MSNLLRSPTPLRNMHRKNGAMSINRKNSTIMTAAILRFSEMDLLNGDVISHEEAIRGFEKTLSE